MTRDHAGPATSNSRHAPEQDQIRLSGIGSGGASHFPHDVVKPANRLRLSKFEANLLCELLGRKRMLLHADRPQPDG